MSEEMSSTSWLILGESSLAASLDEHKQRARTGSARSGARISGEAAAWCAAGAAARGASMAVAMARRWAMSAIRPIGATARDTLHAVGMGREKGKTQDKQAVALLVYCTLRSLKPPL